MTAIKSGGALVLLLLVAAAAGLILILPRPIPIHVPNAGSTVQLDWKLGSSENGLDYFGTGALLASTKWTEADPTQFNLPQPPEAPCKTVEKLTGKPCIWSVSKSEASNGEPLVEVKLNSGDHTLVEAQGMRIQLSDYSELPSTFEGSEHGWISSINVAKWLERLGFGRVGWLAVGEVMKSISSDLGEPAIRVFSDASDSGWGTRLLKDVPGLVQLAAKMWIYKIP